MFFVSEIRIREQIRWQPAGNRTSKSFHPGTLSTISPYASPFTPIPFAHWPPNSTSPDPHDPVGYAHSARPDLAWPRPALSRLES